MKMLQCGANMDGTSVQGVVCQSSSLRQKPKSAGKECHAVKAWAEMVIVQLSGC